MNLQEARKKIPELNGLSDDVALDVIHRNYYPDMAKADLASRLGYKAPEAPVAPRSTMRAVGDLATQFSTGAVSGVRMMSDMFGADNRVSQGLRSAEEALGGLLSAQAVGDQRKIAEIMKEAEGKGWADQVVAGLKAAGVAPGAMMAQALGTSIPTLATALIPGAGPAAVATRLGAAGAMGAAQGAGNIKGVIYEDVKKELAKDPSLTPEQIEARAVEAQSFAGPNAGQIALGGALGVAAGTTGMEKVVSGLRNGVTTAPAGIMGRMLGGGAAEAVPEFAQGGQEKYASNTALNNEGFDVDPMSGVIAQGTMEAAAGFGAGALTGIPKPKLATTPGQDVANTIRAENVVPETGPMTRAANVATEVKAQQAEREIDASVQNALAAQGGATAEESPVVQPADHFRDATKMVPDQSEQPLDMVPQGVDPAAVEEGSAAPDAPQAPDIIGRRIGKRDNLPFSIQSVAQKDLEKRGLTGTHEVVSATDIDQSLSGFLIVKKPGDAAPVAEPLPATNPVAEPETKSASDKPATLPTNLTGAKPNYAYGDKKFSLNFDSDIDRAAYITAQGKPSKKDAEYLKFAMDAAGMTEAEVRAHGQKVKDSIKAQAKGAEPGKLAVPGLYAPKAAPAAKPADGPLIDEGTKPAAPDVTLTNEGKTGNQDQKARWLKAINDENRLTGGTGVQLSVTEDGKLTYLGDPGATQSGRRLLKVVDEARKAGATSEDIAASIRAAKPITPETGKDAQPAPAQAPAVTTESGAPVTRSKSGYAEVKLEGKKHFVTPFDDQFVIRTPIGNTVNDDQRQPLKFATEADAIQYATQNAKRVKPAPVTQPATKKDADAIFGGKALADRNNAVPPNDKALDEFAASGKQAEFDALLKMRRADKSSLTEDQENRFFDLRTERNQAVAAVESASLGRVGQKPVKQPATSGVPEEGAGGSQPPQAAPAKGKYASKDDLDHLFGLDVKRPKAIERVNNGKAYFGTAAKAKDWVKANGIKDTHEVVETKPGRFDVKAKVQGQAAAPAQNQDQNSPQSRWTRATTNERIAIARAGGIQLRAAENVANKAWDKHDPVVQEKLARGLQKQEAAPKSEPVLADLQNAMESAGWTAEVAGADNTIWTKQAGPERYTALHTPNSNNMEVTVLVDGVDTQIASFKVTNPGDAAKAANKAVSDDAQADMPKNPEKSNTSSGRVDETEKNGPVSVGKNEEGKDLMEDANRLRYYVVDGVRIGELVRIVPGTNRPAVNLANRRDEFKTVEELAAEKPAPAAKPADPDAEAKAKAQQDLDDALGELGMILTKGIRKNMMPEQEQALMPVLVKVMDASFRLGYYKFKASAKFVLDTIRAKMGSEAADMITLDHLQGAYIGMAGKYQDKGASTKKEVIAIESLDELAETPIANQPANTENATPKNDGADNATRQLDQPSPSALEGTPAQAVQGVGEQGDSQPAADGRGGGDLAGDAETGGPRVQPAGGVGNDTGAVPVPSRGTRSKRGSTPKRGSENAAGAEREPSLFGDDGRGNSDGESTGRVEAPAFKPTDFTIEEDFALGEGGQKTKYRNNIDAIKLLGQLEKEGRFATPDEQAVLAKYVGWGGLAQAFDEKNENWSKEFAELRGLLTDEEYDAARQSTQYAHYTSRPVIQAMYQALKFFGFTGGRMLEPGAGVGNFMGLMPADLRSSSRLTGVERERIAAGIAKHLYPNQNMQLQDFTVFNAPDGYFDATIGNPPFASFALIDQSGRKHLNGFSVHDYFFGKSIDMLREGGVFAAVVSNGFMDKAGDKARKYIGDRAKLLGAIRLPNNAFAKNANTEVTTDIVFFQKLPESEWGGKAARQDLKRWLDTAVIPDPKGGKPIAVNQYFADNPNMMLGEYGRFGSMYGPDQPALVARPGQDTTALLNAAVDRLPKGIYTAAAKANTEKANADLIEALRDTTVDEGGFYVNDGKLYQRMPDQAGETSARLLTPETQWTEKTKLGESKYQRLVELAAMRKTMRQLLAAELSGDKSMEGLRKTLNEQYDAYTATHGLINDASTAQVFDDDPDFPLLAALELSYERGMGPAAAKAQGIKPYKSKAKKAPIFERRVIENRQQVQRAETAEDALNVSIAERGSIDAGYIAQLLGKPADQVLAELTKGAQPLLFVDPVTGEHVLRDAYLSGNVRKKLEQARMAGADDNVRALMAVQPEDVGAHEISAKLGAPWVPTTVYEDFAISLLGEGTKARVAYMSLNSSFSAMVSAGSDAANTVTFGTRDMPATKILDSLLNNRTVKVMGIDADGKPYLDKEKTDLAQEKAQDIKSKFQDWLFTDPDRSELLVRAYNDTNNNYVTRQFDGSHMTFPGKVPDSIIKFRRHQRNAIARIVQDRTALLDHVVGAGKTFTVISGAMELKRTGLAKKPMIVVPNHLVKQWATDFYRLYPGAKILTATKKDFEKNNRRRFLAKIATGDWDAVIMAHSSFGFVQPDPDYETAFNQGQVNKIMQAIEESKADNGDKSTKRRTVKQLEGMKERLESRIKSLREKPVDNLLDFKQLGVDQLFVDEAHLFKNLMFGTKMQNVRGLGDSKGSQRAYDMYVKVNQIYAQNGRGQGVVFATGTPVSNSLAEMYHMMRYLMPQAMDDGGFGSFDAWANTYAEVSQVWMQKTSGDGFKASDRMGTFSNVHELLKMFDQVSDTVTMDDIKQAFSEENNGKEFPLPKLKGDRRTPVSLEKSQAQIDYMAAIADRAKALEQKKGPPKKGEDNFLTIMSDARKAAMDIRLVDPSITQREPGARIDRASDEVVKRYKQYDSVKGAQLVFSDLGTPLSSAKKELKEYEALQERIAPLQNEDLAASAALGDEAAMRKIEDAEAAQEEMDAKGGDWLGAVQAAMRGFSVYDDMKAALIEKGIPENEIAFIHDFNTDDQKAALFRKVNSGIIRVVIGSTPKMGAGTNVQERLVALHHLDVPWKPSDIEQREGRIIRQGNVLADTMPGFEVEVLAYVTQDTLDMRMWQTQEVKLKMINQLRTRQMSREIENPFEEAEMSAGEMQAAATGNMDLLKEIQLRTDVKKLEQRKRSFDAQRGDLANRKRRAEQNVASLPGRIKGLETLSTAANEYLKSVSSPDFKATINGKDYTSRDLAEQELRRLVDENDEFNKDKAKDDMRKLSVDFNGKVYGSKTALGEAMTSHAGDRDPIAWTFDGQTFNRRSALSKAIQDAVVDAGTTDTAREIGTLGRFTVTVEGNRNKLGVTFFDVSLTVDGKTDDTQVSYTAGGDARGQSDAVIRAVERLVSNLPGRYNMAQQDLKTAQKAVEDLAKVDMPDTWPEMGKLEAARAQHKEVLDRLAGKDEKKPDEAGDEKPVFSRGKPLKGMTKADAQDVVKGITDRWVNAPEVVVVQDMQDAAVPEAARREDARQKSQGASGEPDGFWYDGKAYIVAGALRSPGAVMRVLFHETLGHYGLRGTFGDGLTPILKQLAALRRAEVSAKAVQYGLDMKKEADRLTAAEEVLAEMAQSKPEIGFVKRVIALIRGFLRKNVPGFAKMKMTDEDIIANFLIPARTFVERGPGGGPKGGVSFSRGTNGAMPENTAPGQQGDAQQGKKLEADLEEENRLRTSSGNSGEFLPLSGSISDFSNDQSAPVSGGAMFSRALSAPQLSGQMRDKLNESFNHPGKLSWWHKTVGSQYNLAERNPAFKKVFDAAQSFINDVSYYGTEAANMAPKILPKLETLRDLAKTAISAADNKAVAAPVFEGTLSWARDADGKPIRIEALEKRYENLTDDEKAQMLLRKNVVSEAQLKAWKASKLDVYTGAVRNRFESMFLKAGVRWTDAELKSIFKLTDDQVGLYKEFRAATDTSLDNMAKAQMLREAGKDVADLRDMVMEAPDVDTAAMMLRETLLDMAKDDPDRADVLTDAAAGVLDTAAKINDLKKQGYAPLSRFGRFTVDVVVDGQRQYFGLFESEADSNKMAAKMRMEFGADNVAQGTMSQKEFELFQGITPESLELFGNMMGLDSTGNEAQDKAFQTYLKLTKNNRSAMKRLIHRQGIAGYSEDVGRVLAAFVYANARQGSAALHIGQMDEAITAIPKGEGELKDHALELAKYIKEPREEAAALRGLLFAQYLGGSVASAMVNFTQPLTVSIPYLSQFGGVAKAGKAWAQAVKDMSKGTKLEPGLERALKDAVESGVVSPQETHQLMAQARGAATLQSGDGTRKGDAIAMAKNGWTRTALAWGKLFGYAEQVNRRSTFIAAYRLAVDQKIANPGAFAEKAVNETQFINNKANKMKFGRGAIGATLMTFKSYSLNWLELVHRMSTQDGKDGKLAAAYMLGALFLVAGVGGLPFADDLEDLIDAIGQKMGYNMSTKKAKQEFLEGLFGKAGADFVERGLTGIPGVPIDISGRMGMANLIPGTGLLLEKRDSTRDVMEVLGPVGDLTKRAFQAVGALASGEVGQAMESAAPRAASNIIKGADMLATGMYRDTKGAKVIDTTEGEALAKMIGFQPQSVAKVQESNYINQRAKDFYTLKTQEIRAKWAMGIFLGDQDKVKEARQMMDDWNQDNPDQKMTANMPAIVKKVREMRKDKAQRIADTAPKAMRAQMREDARELAGN